MQTQCKTTLCTFNVQLTTIKAAILYILQLKRVLREEPAIIEEEEDDVEEEEEEKVEEREEPERREIEEELELPSFQLSAQLEKLPPMAVLKPPHHDIQYLQQVLHFKKNYYTTDSQEHVFQKYNVHCRISQLCIAV